MVRVRKPDDIRSECAVPPVVGDGTMTVPVLAGAAKEKPPPTATPRGEEGVAGKNEDDEDDDEEEEEEEEDEDDAEDDDVMGQIKEDSRNDELLYDPDA